MPATEITVPKQCEKASRRYREQLARAMSLPENKLILYGQGHGAAHAAFLAGTWSDARRMLLVTSPERQADQIDSLRQAGMKNQIIPVAGKPGIAADVCDHACEYRGDQMLCYVIDNARLPEMAHWHDAWPDKKPFDFIAVLDGGLYRSETADRNLALKTILDRADGCALLAGSDLPRAAISRLESVWSARAVQVPFPAEP